MEIVCYCVFNCYGFPRITSQGKPQPRSMALRGELIKSGTRYCYPIRHTHISQFISISFKVYYIPCIKRNLYKICSQKLRDIHWSQSYSVVKYIISRIIININILKLFGFPKSKSSIICSCVRRFFSLIMTNI